MKPIERLKYFIENKGNTANKFSQQIGVSNAYFPQQKKNKGNIGFDIIKKILEIYPDLNVEWLITGQGEMIKSSQEKKEEIPENFAVKEYENPESINERIKIIKQKLNLGYSKFAEKIGVNHSAIKNITSGRNKPSFNFIRNLLIAFPYINANWLITGKGNLLKDRVNDISNYLLAEEPIVKYNKTPKINEDEKCKDLKESYKTIIETQKLLIDSLKSQIELLKSQTK